jgi:FKBP-type peptidyl-prolyl cis-trans isomerase FkpA
VAAPSPSRFWLLLAAFSLLGNVVLIGWLAQTRGPAARTAAPAVVQPAPSPPVAVPRPKPAGPYAALGSYMAENNRIADLGWTEAQFQAFLDGFRASYEGRGLPLDEDARKLRDDISRKVQQMLAKEQPDPAEEYFRTLRDKEGVKQTPSGLHYRITEVGSGPRAQAGDTVVMSFAARLPDGRNLSEFSRARVRLAVKDLLPGLAEGVQLLSVGGKALVYLPPKLAYSDENWPPQIPRGMPLAFFVELHEIVPAAAR